MNKEHLEHATIDEVIVYLQKLSKEGYGDYIFENIHKNISKDECCCPFPEHKVIILGVCAYA